RTDHQLKVLAPFAPIPDGKPWGMLLDVPKKVLVAPAEALKAQLDADNTQGTLLELGLGLLLAAVVGLILVRPSHAARHQPHQDQTDHGGQQA
ncbi:hypothetical protein, partial [Pseudomonas viridiflava]|uniref:hypothetical protein n=1 Tax=Pseudomonas viridiflava TaxID=33069 RepID=UPI001F1478F3